MLLIFRYQFYVLNCLNSRKQFKFGSCIHWSFHIDASHMKLFKCWWVHCDAVSPCQ